MPLESDNETEIKNDIHVLKTWPDYFQAVIEERKTFEIRKNDRDFKVGDEIILDEWDPKHEQYTGRVALVRITYILEGTFAIMGKCLMSIKLLEIRTGPPPHECEGCPYKSICTYVISGGSRQ